MQHRAGAGAGTGARAGTGAGVKIRGKVEPELEPKINGFDSATLEKTDPSNKHPGAEEGPEVNILSLRYSLTLIPMLLFVSYMIHTMVHTWSGRGFHLYRN